MKKLAEIWQGKDGRRYVVKDDCINFVDGRLWHKAQHINAETITPAELAEMLRD